MAGTPFIWHIRNVFFVGQCLLRTALIHSVTLPFMALMPSSTSCLASLDHRNCTLVNLILVQKPTIYSRRQEKKTFVPAL